MSQIRRRQFLLASGALLAAPLIRAQQPNRVWRIGYLSYTAMSFAGPYLDSFKRGMTELGYVEGKNYFVDVRTADAKADRLAALAAELAQLKVDIILVGSGPAARAAHQATRSIPIVLATSTDPVGLGLIKTLAHPGGNVTGLSDMTVDLSSKYLELITSIVPDHSRIALLVNPLSPNSGLIVKGIQEAAQTRRLEIISASAANPTEIETAFRVFGRQKARALIVAPDVYFGQQQTQIIALSTKGRLPSIAAHQGYPEAGGLMGYGPNFHNNFRRAATYVDKILKGANPGDLPVEQPMNLEFVINRRTAKALGLTIPQELLLRADRVIE